MAVGARITSQNLSGKTATVTFIPYTGSTSGTSVNIGEVTIPFNNITSHPYGVYSLYFAEYDYTYTLTIEEPVTSQETFVLVSQMVGSDNYGAITLNFTDFDAEIIDFGIDASVWGIDDIHPITNGGYMYEFEGRGGDYESKYVIFTDASNQIIDTYTGTTNNTDLDAYDGTWVAYIDNQNGVMKYSNGVNVYTYTWDASYQDIDIEWEEDSTTPDGSFIIEKESRDVSTDTVTGSTYYLMKTDGTQDQIFSLTSGYTSSFHYGPAYNFMVNITYDNVNQNYVEFDIRDTDGNIIGDSHTFGDTIYTSFDFSFYGTNKCVLVFYNNSDSSVDYKIYHYNGDTDILTESTHNKTNYPSFSIESNNFFWPDDNISENLVLTFYNPQNWIQYGTEVSYCDIMYMMSGQTGFTTYNLIDTGSFDKTIYPWGQISDVGYFTVTSGNMGNGFIEILTITPESGVTITETSMLTSDTNGTNWDGLGNKYFFSIDYSGYTLHSIHLVGPNGLILDSLTDLTNLNWNSTRSIGIVRTNNTNSYYVNNTTTGFTSMNFYNDVYYVVGYQTGTYLDQANLLAFNTNTGFARMVNANSIGTEFQFPEGTDWAINIGYDKIMYTYLDTDTNTFKIKLYDFNGTLLNEHDTEHSSRDNTFTAKNRYVVVTVSDNTYTAWMINETSVLSQVITDLDSYSMINDYIWWD